MSLAHIEPRALAAAEPVSAGTVTLVDELRLWQDCFELAKAIATTPFVPETIRNNPAAVMATILRGHELGVTAMHSLQQIDFIKGRPALRSELMRALVSSKGHEIWTEEFTQTRVTLCGRRSGTEHVQKVTWTLDDAKRAGLLGNPSWRAYPRAMLLARATGELCRLMFADVLAGMSYTLEEIEDGFDDAGDPVPALEGEAPSSTTTARATKPTARKRTSTRRAAPMTGPADPPPLPDEIDQPGPASPPPRSGEGEPVDAGGHSSEGAPPVPAGEPDEVVVKRAQMIAMRANDAGVDHHLVIAAVTNGAKSSAKAVTAEEGSQVLEALVKIRQGRLVLKAGDGQPPVLVEGRPEDGLPDSPELDADDEPVEDGLPDLAASWTPTHWRSFLSTHGVKATVLLAEAQRLAREDGDTPPASLEALAGRDSLCELLVSFVLSIEAGS